MLPPARPPLPPAGDAPPAALSAAIDAEARRRLDTFLRGVELYRRHPARRRLRDPEACWQAGQARLLDYAGCSRPEQRQSVLSAPPVLLVPSLVNRATILDLHGRRSLTRYLARQGVRPFLLDWGWPDAEEEKFSLQDYIIQRLEPAIAAVRAKTGQKPVIAGYCMGGLLALAACLRQPGEVSGYVALATPWDFHSEASSLVAPLLPAREALSALISRLGAVPVDLLQVLFVLLEPAAVVRKFRRFSRLAGPGQTRREQLAGQKNTSFSGGEDNWRNRQANAFVALEDWLNDGIPLAGPVAVECLNQWYGDNLPARRDWWIGETRIDPAALTVPSLVMIPQRDRIVPPASAEALARQLAGAPGGSCRLDVPLGHIGMMAGSTALRDVYAPLARWIRQAAGSQSKSRADEIVCDDVFSEVTKDQSV